jgi:phenylacetate-CoA ligase
MPATLPENLARPALERMRDEGLADLFAVLPRSQFYVEKLAAAGIDPASLRGRGDLAHLPFTIKPELVADQASHPPYGGVLTEPVAHFCRMHQTSGTVGRPLRWLDTADSWAWMLDNWTAYFRIVGVQPGDVLFFPFSFGPFIGFWTGFEAAARLGCLCLPGGGMGSTARLRFLLDNRATVVLCTPTYALRLAEVAQGEGIDLSASPVSTLIVAGEPGGSVAGTRERIAASWGARVFDHHGMTEVGPASIECRENPGGLHVLESAYIAEIIDPASGRPVSPGVPGELVLTTLGRLGSPLVRYRTGDVVCADPRPCPCGRALLRLEGGIRGRVDDMIHLRGNNVHPAALQTILHRIPEVAEYRLEVDRSGTLPVLRVEVEPLPNAMSPALAARVDQAIRDELLFRAEVRVVPPGTLPRFELKAQRLVRKSPNGTATEAAT